MPEELTLRYRNAEKECAITIPELQHVNLRCSPAMQGTPRVRHKILYQTEYSSCKKGTWALATFSYSRPCHYRPTMRQLTISHSAISRYPASVLDLHELCLRPKSHYRPLVIHTSLPLLLHPPLDHAGLSTMTVMADLFH